MANDKMKLKITKRELFIDYIPTALVAVMIIAFAIVKNQPPIMTLPTLVTLVVMIMSVRANRYAFLVGAANCILYTIAYINGAVYFSAVSALLVSMPIQIFSFFVWSKHKTSSTKSELIRMKWWQLLLSTIAVFPAWAGCYFGLSAFFEGNMAWIDSLIFVLGILISALVAFRFIEGQYFNVISCVLNLVMWAIICASEPSNINFVIIGVYNLLRVIQATVTWTSLYIKQQKEKQLA